MRGERTKRRAREREERRVRGRGGMRQRGEIYFGNYLFFFFRNYQTGAEPTWLNDGKFQDNGHSGYVLKPQYMREEKITFNPEGKHSNVKQLIVNV